MNTVEQIKQKLGIIDVVSIHVKLEKAGANLKGKCPFHNEKTASFFVSPARNSYYCFGCNAKGDIFSFVQDFEKVDFKGALKILAERAGVRLEDYNPKEEKERDVSFSIMEEATKFYEEKLASNAEAEKYLLDRGLKIETIRNWRLGWAPASWSDLTECLKKKGFKEVDMEKVGLNKPGNHGHYDRFRSRIMFPIFDTSGRTVGFTGRIFETGGKDVSKEPKYINSPDTPLFNKSEILYGYHKAKDAIRTKGFVLLVEGQMDLLMCHQAGLSQAIATSGTALTEAQLLIIKRFTSNLMIAYDGDKAGVDASKRAFKIALSLGFDVKLAPLPKGEDPADIIKKDYGAFKDALRKSQHIIDFSLENIMQRGLSGRALIKEVIEEVVPFVDAVSSPSQRAYFISKMAERMRIRENALYEEITLKIKEEPATFKSISRADKEGSAVPGVGSEKKHRKDLIEGKIAGLVFKSDPKTQSVMKDKFSRLLEDVPGVDFGSFISTYEDEKEMLIYDAESNEEEGDEQAKFEELLIELKREILKVKLENAALDLKLAENENNSERQVELLKLCQEITSKLANLSI
jgi:DNA primase